MPGTVWLDDLDEGLDPVVAASCTAHVGHLDRAERLAGGNVSHVYRIHGRAGTAVLKLRRSRFARLPELVTRPDLVAVEAAILRRLAGELGDALPGVLAVHPDRGALLLTDLGPGRPTLAETWQASDPTVEQAGRLGRLLARLHAIGAPGGLRDGDDAEVRRHLTGYAFGPAAHPRLAEAAARCLAEPGRPVHGDVSPKNLLEAPDRLLLCDFDNAHLGSATLDLGYAAAHLVLHGGGSRPVHALLAGYDPESAGARAADPWFATVVAGVLSYRLASPVVPYPLPIGAGARRASASALLGLLDAGPPRLDAVAGCLTGALR